MVLKMFSQILLLVCLIIINGTWAFELYNSRDLEFIDWAIKYRTKFVCLAITIIILFIILVTGDPGFTIYSVLPSNYTPPLSNIKIINNHSNDSIRLGFIEKFIYLDNNSNIT